MMKKPHNAQLKIVNSERSISDYSSFEQINGKHPFKTQVPGAFVDYQAFRKNGGKVVYFNFALAEEMGLITAGHPKIMNDKLENAILDAFAIQIINEFDLEHPRTEIFSQMLPRQYMATRYLQLQHPTRKGETSGDGRSIWNGVYKGDADHHSFWDITSCGTGATCLSPATWKFEKFFATGDPMVSYGCGLAEVKEGLSTALLSEAFHQNGIRTERCLGIIEFNKGLSINIRAGKNLIRPSHLFGHLKQGNYNRLKGVLDYYLERQTLNNEFQVPENGNKYLHFLNKFCEQFAFTAALFESEYIFCWMDWDGDNILMDGGIIDYGSIRQFGLFHHEYRYDDVDRYSTNITEQKSKARYIVQTMIQAVDFIISKKKKNIKDFQTHSLLKKFDEKFATFKREMLLTKMGISSKVAVKINAKLPRLVENFLQVFEYFERTTSTRGLREVADGITVDAVFCMRDILRELPYYLQQSNKLMPPAEFLEILKSKYARPSDLYLDHLRVEKIKLFQKIYIEIIKQISVMYKVETSIIFKTLQQNGLKINKHLRITGDGAIYLADYLAKERKNLKAEGLYQVVQQFVADYLEGRVSNKANSSGNPKVQKVKEALFRIVGQSSEGL